MAFADPSSGTPEEGSMRTMARMRKGTAARVLVASAAALTLGGCAMKGDVRDLQSEIRTLAARQDSLLAELRAAMVSAQDTIRTQSDQMFDFRGELNRQLREMNESLRTLQALAGENQRAIAGMRDQLGGGRPGVTSVPPVSGGDPAAAGDAEQIVPGATGSAGQQFDAALALLDRGSLNTAARAFQEFLQAHPNDARAVDAHFYLADILWQQDRPEEALSAFQQIPTLFPTADRVPDALFRIARIQLDMGDTESAKTTLQRIVNTYPSSTVAMLARDALEEIG